MQICVGKRDRENLFGTAALFREEQRREKIGILKHKMPFAPAKEIMEKFGVGQKRHGVENRNPIRAKRDFAAAKRDFSDVWFWPQRHDHGSNAVVKRDFGKKLALAKETRR